MKRNLPYYIVDVFAENRYAGNQLAVFTKPKGLSDEEMQKIALEINYAETTFILSDQQENGGYEVRIFTPMEEVPFAGHPTLGTAFIINNFSNPTPQEKVALNLKVGQIPVKVAGPNYWMKQINPIFGASFSIKMMMEVLGLEEEDFYLGYPIEEVSTGLPFLIVPLKSLAAVKKAQVNRPAWQQHLRENQPMAKMIMIFSPETYKAENDLNCRMFGEELGVVEDAATGSANGCLLGYLLKNNYFGKKSIDISVEQGYEMMRPSLLLHSGSKVDEQTFDINIGGQVQLVAEGLWY